MVRFIISIGATFANPAKAMIPPAIGEAARPKQDAISIGKTRVIGATPNFVAISRASFPKL